MPRHYGSRTRDPHAHTVNSPSTTGSGLTDTSRAPSANRARHAHAHAHRRDGSSCITSSTASKRCDLELSGLDSSPYARGCALSEERAELARFVDMAGGAGEPGVSYFINKHYDLCGHRCVLTRDHYHPTIIAKAFSSGGRPRRYETFHCRLVAQRQSGMERSRDSSRSRRDRTGTAIRRPSHRAETHPDHAPLVVEEITRDVRSEPSDAPASQHPAEQAVSAGRRGQTRSPTSRRRFASHILFQQIRITPPPASMASAGGHGRAFRCRGLALFAPPPAGTSVGFQMPDLNRYPSSRSGRRYKM